MKLTSINNLELSVIRNGEFQSLGMLNHDDNDMLVAFYDDSMLHMLKGNSCIRCVLTTPDMADIIPQEMGVGVCTDPLNTLFCLHKYLTERTSFYGAKRGRQVSATAKVSELAFIARQCVHVGDGCVIEPGAAIMEGSQLGEGVVVRSGAVIGGQGYEVKTIDGRMCVVPHAGGVCLKNGVEVFCNSHIARSLFGGNTVIGEETIIDALVHISHHVKVGQRCKIAAGAAVGGSTRIGNRVWIGLNATVSSGLTIGDDAHIAMGAVVGMHIPNFARVMGNPARIVKVSSYA